MKGRAVDVEKRIAMREDLWGDGGGVAGMQESVKRV